MNSHTLTLAKRVLKWLSIGFLSLSLLLLVLFSAALSLALWHPNAVNSALPYVSQWTNGQLQIESSEGRLIDGLTLQNISFKNQKIDLEIEKIEWQWRLSALFKRQAYFDKLQIIKPKLRLISSDSQADMAFNPAPFEAVSLFDFTADIMAFTLTQASLQFNNETPIEIAHLSSAIHWQGQTLKLDKLLADYQAYQLQATSTIEILNAAKFKAKLQLKLLGVAKFPEIQLTSEIQGGLKQLKFKLDTLQPYVLHSEHVLARDKTIIQLNSHWNDLNAKFSEQWMIKHLQGDSALVYNLQTQQISSQGKLKIDLADKPQVQFNYAVDYSKEGIASFDIDSLLDQMGRLKAQGQANIRNSTLDLNVQTEQLNLQWLNPTLGYQISSDFNWLISDFEKRQSQLKIKQFDLGGFPEALSFNGLVNTDLNALSDYAVEVQSSKLDYASHSGQLQVKLTLNQALSKLKIDKAKLTLGDNQIDLAGDWDDKFNLHLNAQLNRLDQLYKPLSGKMNLSLNSQGTLRKDLSGFDQAWSNLKLKAQELHYQPPSQNTKTDNGQIYTLKQLKIDAKVPLHKPEWSTFSLVADELEQISNAQESKHLLSKLELSRQPNKKGLASQLKVSHPEITVNAQAFEAAPSFKQQKILLNRFEIEQPLTGSWHLEQDSTIDWKAPYQVSTPEICLKSNEDKLAKLCVESQANRATWSVQALPFLDWIKPWLSKTLILQGRLNGEGSANWEQTLHLQQSLSLPKLDLTFIEQGYKFPLVLKNWQTQIKLADNKLRLNSQAQINETGSLHAEIQAKNNQAWSTANIDGQIHLQINEWLLSKRVLEVLELNQTELSVESNLSGQLNAIQHDTQAKVALNLNLPLLGLSNQNFNLQAKLSSDSVEASGIWQQAEQRQADLTLQLTDIKTQPKLTASFKTESIELLQTDFARLKTSADMSVTLLEGSAHIQGVAQLHNSNLNLDAMPLHERTLTSDDEIIIDERGNIVQKPAADFKLSYDVKIGFGNQVKVNVHDAQTFLGGEIRLVKHADSPEKQAFGKVTLREGYINLDLRNQIQIDPSHFSFNGAIDNPTLNVNLSRLVDQTTARLNITGNATQPQFMFYSTPALSQGRIINLMIFGRAGDLAQEPNYESQVLSAFYKLGIQNNTPVLNTLTRTLGIEDIYFDVQNQKVSSLLVGRALTDKLYVRYAKDLTGQQGNAVQFFYQLTQKWLLKSDSGDNRSSVDLIYRLER